MTVVQTKLGALLHSTTAPFLFVGSGLSRRYIGAEDWEGLLRRFAALTPRPYEFYRASAEGDLPTVASKIAEVFHDIWWTSDDFEASRREWASSTEGIESALKVEIAKHLSVLPSMDGLGPTESAEIALLREAVVDGVITTNYDPLLEDLFPEYRTFVGQDELLFANPQGVGEIYKVHGSYHKPNSLVLTAKDYATFERRNAYLAAKLMTIFVEHPVVFLGYSLGDRNVISILRSVAGCLKPENVDELRDRLIFIQWEPDVEPTVGPHTIMLDGGFSLTVLRVTVPDFREVFALLADLRRAFPAKMLRRLKEQVYDLVLSDDPHSRLYVADIDDDSREDDIEVVFGVGVSAQLGKTGYVGLGRWDIIDDVISGGSDLDASAVLHQVLPRLAQSGANIPVYKYLREAGALDENGCIRESANVDRRVQKMAEKSCGGISTGASYKKASSRYLEGVQGVADLLEKHGVKEVLNYAVYLAPEGLPVDELRSFLESEKEGRETGWKATQYVKLVCFLDWLTYGISPTA